MRRAFRPRVTAFLQRAGGRGIVPNDGHMLQPHSFLWHYLWVGSDVLLLSLAALAWRRGLHRFFPAFFVYLVYEGIQGLTLYLIDRVPWFSDDTYWRADIAELVIEPIVKVGVIWELFSRLLAPRPSLARLGNRLIGCSAGVLVALAALAASHAPIGNYAIVSYAHILEQTIFLIEAGLMLFIFLFTAYFHLDWSRRDFGIALGLSVSACVGLAVLAIYANLIFFKKLYLVDLLKMGVYHVCVLIWFYYLLSPSFPSRAPSKPSPLPKQSQIRRVPRRCGNRGPRGFSWKADS
jgi:hypothetical protein